MIKCIVKRLKVRTSNLSGKTHRCITVYTICVRRTRERCVGECVVCTLYTNLYYPYLYLYWYKCITQVITITS